MRNVEIKARIGDLSTLFDRAKGIADSGPVEILQDDTFFACERGRLKLREFHAEAGELIFYRRPDSSAPKVSEYLIAKTPEPSKLREALAQAYGVVGRVRKRRQLFLVKNTRIHLDEVEGLGTFMELEVVLGADDTIEEGQATAGDLMSHLGIARDDLIETAYVDLLNSKDQQECR